MNPDIAGLRKEYASQMLLEEDAAYHPVDQFEKWWLQAVQSELTEVNAMTLATSSCDGMPSARIVLLKDFSHDGFVFYTNYTSYKSMQLQENPKACLVFFWKELERQVRIVGLVNRVSEAESDTYFLSRPIGSQVGALTSPQSRIIESREWLDKRYDELLRQYSGKTLERPEHWGGYTVNPIIMEFWQGRPNRLHDRLQYTLEEDGNWRKDRLAP